jgi:beta-lactamase class A
VEAPTISGVLHALALAAVLSGPEAPRPSPIESRIAARLASFRGRMGVAATELDTGESVEVDADLRFPTASVIKTAVMVEVFHRLAEGSLRRDQLVTLGGDAKVGGSGVLQDLRAGGQYSVRELLHLMIALSDNTATNLLIGLVGTNGVNERMRGYGLAQTRLYRPTFRGGQADAFPEEEKEFGLGSSTPRETARLMERIARGGVVSREACDEMIAILRRQQFREMIPRLLPGDEAGVSVAHKTGQDLEKRPGPAGALGAVRADAAIVTTPKGRYVVAIFARRVADERWSVDNEAFVAGAEVSRLLYDHFTGR